MRPRVRSGLTLLALAALAACGRPDDALVDLRLYAMATTVSLRLPAGAEREHPGLVAAIEADLRQFERDYYPWADGELAALNRALTAGETFDASTGLARLLRRARAIAAASDGAFDPGVGVLVELWGFDDGTDPPTAAPDPAAIAAARAAAGSVRDLVIDGPAISAPAAAYTLDLGGIAKGAAVDRAVARLEALGVAPALVDAGGDLRVVGSPPGRDWRIGIQAPRGDGLLGTIALENGEAAFSSGDYERYFERDGERLHHILDPRTGMPVAHTRAVTVVAGDGTTADAAATAIFVAGPAGWPAVADRLGISAVLRVDADGRIEMTSAMRDRFQPGAIDITTIIVAGD